MKIKNMRFFILPILALNFISACQKSSQPSQTVSLKGKPFSFEVESVSKLALSKNAPETQDVWTTILTKDQNKGIWLIQSAPNGAVLLDPLAHSEFINHLLDTLRTLNITSQPNPGPLESFGLAAPRYALRWLDYEIQIGDFNQNQNAYYALINNQVYLVQGSTMGMLDHLRSFQTLRHPRVLTWSSHDVVEMKIRTTNNKPLYAQRQSGEWADKKNKPYTQSLHPWLEQLTHLRAARFLDDPQENARMLLQIAKKPTFEVELINRFGQKNKITLSSQGSKLYATVSERPKSVFELDPSSLKLLLLPAKK